MFVGSLGIIQSLISAACSILNINLYNFIIFILHKQYNNAEHCAALRLIGILAFPTCRRLQPHINMTTYWLAKCMKAFHIYLL